MNLTEHVREKVWQYVGYVDSCIDDDLMPMKFDDWYKKWYGRPSEERMLI